MQVKNLNTVSVINHQTRWLPPEEGCLKLNVDAAVPNGSNSFSVGLVLRNHLGEFKAGKVVCLQGVDSVFEAEVNVVAEGLSWIISLPYQNISIESDSLLTVQAIKRGGGYEFEVGHTIDRC